MGLIKKQRGTSTTAIAVAVTAQRAKARLTVSVAHGCTSPVRNWGGGSAPSATQPYWLITNVFSHTHTHTWPVVPTRHHVVVPYTTVSCSQVCLATDECQGQWSIRHHPRVNPDECDPDTVGAYSDARHCKAKRIDPQQMGARPFYYRRQKRDSTRLGARQ